jgi:methylamine---corrinoid protein Co-methyltransferase
MQNMTRLLDVIDRAYSGPFVDEKEFDLKYVAHGVAGVLKKYGIKFNKEQVIQRDDDLNDRLWQAGLEFFENCGIYNASTHRLIQFSHSEIEEVLRWMPQEVTIGEGPDARPFRLRQVEDPTPPQVSGGPIGTPLSEELWIPIMQSYWQEPVIDLVVPGTLATCYGREVRSDSPLEIIASWQEAHFGAEAARRAGRPGTARMCVEMAISDVGHLSSISRGGFKPSDVQVVAMIGEMKTNNELLNKIAHSIQQNGTILGFYNPILGGLAGPEEGVALLIVAGFIALSMIYMPASVESCPTHPFNFNSTAPQILRAVSAASAAVRRNSHLLTEFMTSPVSGPMTESLLYECVGMATVASTCGAARVLGVRSAVGVELNHCSGLETRFNGEVAQAAAGLERGLADEIVKKALAQYESVLGTRPVGLPFDQVYDPVRVRPIAEWQAMYDKVKEQVFRWGLPIK